MRSLPFSSLPLLSFSFHSLRRGIFFKLFFVGSVAVSLFNRLDITPVNITVSFSSLGFAQDDHILVRDLFAREDLGVFQQSFTTPQEVPPHGALLVKMSKMSTVAF